MLDEQKHSLPDFVYLANSDRRRATAIFGLHVATCTATALTAPEISAHGVAVVGSDVLMLHEQELGRLVNGRLRELPRIGRPPAYYVAASPSGWLWWADNGTLGGSPPMRLVRWRAGLEAADPIPPRDERVYERLAVGLDGRAWSVWRPLGHTSGAHLCVASPDGRINEWSIEGLPKKWRPFSALPGPGETAIVGCSVDGSTFTPAFAVVEPDPWRILRCVVGWAPIAPVGDGAQVIVSRTPPESRSGCQLGIAAPPYEQVGVVCDVNTYIAISGQWCQESLPTPSRSLPFDTVPLPVPQRPRHVSPEGIVNAQGTTARLNEYGGTLVVQLRAARPEARAVDALRAASDDLYWLDTPPEEEGDHEIPSSISPVQVGPDGPFVVIDANDTDSELLERIPEILKRHLAAAGVTSAELWFGNLEDLD